MASIPAETWTWYGVVVLMLGLRYAARIMHFHSVRKLQAEDWFMLVVYCMYTVLIVFLNICADVSTNLIDPADADNLTPQDIKDRIYGSKCVLVVESAMCFVQWGTKACLLALFFRLTQNLRQAIIVKLAAAYCFITYVVMISLYYGYWCRPFHAFWETPTSNIQCATQIHHLILNLVFNLTSDLLIIFIPLPLFVKAKLEPKKKLLLIFPFSLGFFTMICAILSKHLSFTQPFSSEWIYWYTREASTAMIVTNLPYSWAIFRKVLGLKPFFGKSGSTSTPATVISGKYVDGVNVPTATRSHGPNTRSWPSRNPTHLFSRRDTLKPLTGRTGSAGSQLVEHDDFHMMSWKKEHEIDGKSDPLSSPSFEGSGAYSVKHDPIDRLYSLDDDDLEGSLAKPAAVRHYEP